MVSVSLLRAGSAQGMHLNNSKLQSAVLSAQVSTLEPQLVLCRMRRNLWNTKGHHCTPTRRASCSGTASHQWNLPVRYKETLLLSSSWACGSLKQREQLLSNLQAEITSPAAAEMPSLLTLQRLHPLLARRSEDVWVTRPTWWRNSSSNVSSVGQTMWKICCNKFLIWSLNWLWCLWLFEFGS